MAKTAHKIVNKKVDKHIDSVVEVPETLHFSTPSTPSSPTLSIKTQQLQKNGNIVTDNVATTKDNDRAEKNKDKLDANRFVTNLSNEINQEARYNLTDLDRQFISSIFHDVLGEVTASYEAITEALNSKNSIEAAMEKKFQGQMDALHDTINSLKLEIGALSNENTTLVTEAKENSRKQKGEITKKVNDHKEKKNHEITKLKLVNESLKNELSKLSQQSSTSSVAKKLNEEVHSHKRTKELHKIKLSCKEEVVSILTKAKQDLIQRNKDLAKKLDGVEKEFRSFHKQHALILTKQSGQMKLQKSKNSQKFQESQEKSAQKAETFMRLQQQMKSAVTSGSYHHQYPFGSDMGNSFRDMTGFRGGYTPPGQHMNMGFGLMEGIANNMPLSKSQEKDQSNMISIALQATKAFMDQRKSLSQDTTVYDRCGDRCGGVESSASKKLTEMNDDVSKTNMNRKRKNPKQLPTQRNLKRQQPSSPSATVSLLESSSSQSCGDSDDDQHGISQPFF